MFIQDSRQSAIIPLSSNIKLQEKYVSVLGHIRAGRLMEDMDIFAGYISDSSCFSFELTNAFLKDCCVKQLSICLNKLNAFCQPVLFIRLVLKLIKLALQFLQ